MRLPRIGILGGTFDPPHVGHLALARSARAALALDRLLLVPTGASWQKRDVQATPQQRLRMLQLAFDHEPGIEVDAREVTREGPSYTVDTLAQLRQTHGPNAALILILGSDQVRNLATWHRWQSLTDLAHIACTQREQVPLSDLPEAVESLVRAHGCERLPERAAGAIVFFSMPPVPVSSTTLRLALARGERPAELVAPAVLDYIDQHQLYRAQARATD